MPIESVYMRYTYICMGMHPQSSQQFAGGLWGWAISVRGALCARGAEEKIIKSGVYLGNSEECLRGPLGSMGWWV
jgi:hypothetical protein